MARMKTNTRRSKAAPAQDRYTAELSTGQLVIGMSIFLTACLASFLMGIVVGKFDPSLKPDIALESLPDAAPGSADRNVAAVESTPSARTGPPPEMRVPRQRERAAASGGASPSKSEDPAKASSGTAIEQPDGSTPKEDPDSTSGLPAEAADEGPGKAEVAAPPPAPDRTQTAALLRTRYGVQVAAFQTRQRADIVKRDLEAKSSYKADLVLSSSGRLVKVVVGSYADRQSVNKVRDDLKQNFGYADCFVTTRQ